MLQGIFNHNSQSCPVFLDHLYGRLPDVVDVSLAVPPVVSGRVDDVCVELYLVLSTNNRVPQIGHLQGRAQSFQFTYYIVKTLALLAL